MSASANWTQSINFSRIYFKIMYSKILYALKVSYILSSLVHAFIVKGKSYLRFLKKSYFILNLETVSEFRVIRPRLYGNEIMLKNIDWSLVFNEFIKITRFPIPTTLLKRFNSQFLSHFFLVVTFTTLFITNN